MAEKKGILWKFYREITYNCADKNGLLRHVWMNKIAKFRGFWKWFPGEFRYFCWRIYKLRMPLKQSRCRGENFVGYISVQQAGFVAYIFRFTGNI